ncbi:MAG: hypothetical protein KF710_05205 [Rhodocyclaceae bacterium]|nr:hypothetical protein [Rhodocyclaceae bacterium]
MKKCTTSEQDQMIKSSTRPQSTMDDQVDYYDYGLVLASQAIARITGRSSVRSGETAPRQDEPSIAGRLADCFDLGRFMCNVTRHTSHPTD